MSSLGWSGSILDQSQYKSADRFRNARVDTTPKLGWNTNQISEYL